MKDLLTIVTGAVVLGVGATAIMDMWALVLRRTFGIASLDLALLGRWIGHLARGKFRHDRIANTAPIRHERIIGWSAHYAIGVTFAALLLGGCGVEWLQAPTLLPPLIVSYVTLAAPFLVMQPAMGAGIASSRTPRPNLARLRSIATHTVYGLGLYLVAWTWTVLAG